MKTKNSIDRGGRIKEIRLRLDITQEELGKAIGRTITKGSVSGYEKGDTNPSVDTFIKIAKLGNVSLDYLITGQEKKPSFINDRHLPKHQRIRDGRAAPKTPTIGIKPTAKLTHLRWIVEWMDAYFTANEEEALIFYEQLKDMSPSFAEFIENEKKRTSEDHQDRFSENTDKELIG